MQAIEVILSNGDRAVACDPEAAVAAARQLAADDWQEWPIQGRNLTAAFYVGGNLVRIVGAGQL